MTEPTMAVPSDAPKANWLKGILASIVGALIVGIVYAAIIAFTEHEIGYLALLIGFVAGFALVKFGKVSGVAAGIVAAIIALVVWIFSIELGTAWYLSQQGYSFGDTLLEILKHPVDMIKVYFEADVKSYLFAALAAIPAFITGSGLRNKK